MRTQGDGPETRVTGTRKGLGLGGLGTIRFKGKGTLTVTQRACVSEDYVQGSSRKFREVLHQKTQGFHLSVVIHSCL